MIPSFFEFLDSKPLYYKEIDYTRVYRAYAILAKAISHPKAIHIIGTNGKGSTGRILASLAWKGGLSVGHYSSPHILQFNERIWIDGNNISDRALESGHQRLYTLLGSKMSEALSYFEYTTLLALLLFQKCDLIVLEAGLGGEFDATNVLENRVLTILTPVGIDHQAFLGDSINEIATTKLRSLRAKTKLLLAPQPYIEVESIAKEIANKRDCELKIVEPKIDKIKEYLEGKGWAEFLSQNALVAIEALTWLGVSFEYKSLRDIELFGRYYPLRENIHIDVGHNPLGAKALFRAMEQNTTLIYNSLDDKDYYQVLSILRPKLKEVKIIPIDSQRAVTLNAIEEALNDLELPWSYFDGEIKESENYLVFGSFYTVEAFLKSTNF